MQKTTKNSFDFTDLIPNLALVNVWELDFTAQKIIFLKQFGSTPDDSYKYDWEDFLKFVHSHDRDILSLSIKNAMLSNLALEIEFRVLVGDKIEWFAAHASKNAIHKLSGVFINISDRRKNNDFLSQRQAQLANLVRISSLGEMASMLSHEISQPLVVINSYIAGCIRRLESGIIDKTTLISTMKKVNEHVELAGSLIHRLKNYFRKDGLNYERIHIHNVIKGAIALLTYEKQILPASIEYDFEENLPSIEIDRLQIKLVILGLLHNSIDAILETKLKKSKIIIQSRRISDDMLAISIIDFGCGISNEIKNKLFNTYCTTKTTGSGLTLIICRGIIEAHNGELTAENNNDYGTKFTFTLPLSSE